jgi:hypothetical protein
MKKALPGYQRNLDSSVLTAFPLAVEALLPGATGSQIAALLDHKAKRTTVLQWVAGRHPAPRWAMDILAAKHRARAAMHLAIAETADKAKPGPGKKAGTRNLLKWKAERAARGG